MTASLFCVSRVALRQLFLFVLQLLDQLMAYFTNEFPNILLSRAHFMVLGQKLYQQYPSIKRDGKCPWSTLMRLLSGHLRLKR